MQSIMLVSNHLMIGWVWKTSCTTPLSELGRSLNMRVQCWLRFTPARVWSWFLDHLELRAQQPALDSILWNDSVIWEVARIVFCTICRLLLQQPLLLNLKFFSSLANGMESTCCVDLDCPPCRHLIITAMLSHLQEAYSTFVPPLRCKRHIRQMSVLRLRVEFEACLGRQQVFLRQWWAADQNYWQTFSYKIVRRVTEISFCQVPAWPKHQNDTTASWSGKWLIWRSSLFL